MKVKAIRLGYYNHLRMKEDTVFTLKDEKHFSSKWMEKVSDDYKPKKGKKNEPSWQPHADDEVL